MRFALPAVPVGTVVAAAAAALVPVDRRCLKVCNAFCAFCALLVVVVLLMPCKNHRRISREPDMTFGLHFELLIYACAVQASCASGI